MRMQGIFKSEVANLNIFTCLANCFLSSFQLQLVFQDLAGFFLIDLSYSLYWLIGSIFPKLMPLFFLSERLNFLVYFSNDSTVKLLIFLMKLRYSFYGILFYQKYILKETGISSKVSFISSFFFLLYIAYLTVVSKLI